MSIQSGLVDDSRIDIFISHSSRDAELAKAFAELFRSALNLPAKRIRCTSVSGYKLDVGADTNAQLRRETVDAAILIGLITQVSIESTYVLFELGARWGAQKFLAPMIGAGKDHSILAGPLLGLNALLCTREDLLQLVSNVAHELKVKPEGPEAYVGAIDNVVKASDLLASSQNQGSSELGRGLELQESITVSKEALDYLMTVSRPRNKGKIWGDVSSWSGREGASNKEIVDNLCRLQLMTFFGGSFELTTRGWKMADQLWQLSILDSLPDSDAADTSQIATSVELTDGDDEATELGRHLHHLETSGFIKISRRRGPSLVRITHDGLTYRKHRPLSIE